MINIVGISGGKDSTATALVAIETLKTPPRFVFCDTGIEAPSNYEYVNYLSEKLKAITGQGVEIIKADFSARIAKKAEKLRNQGEIKRAEALAPTGNPFVDLCIWKGRFPSTKARFCTQELKMNPTIAFVKNLMVNADVVSWSGERAEESIARANKPEKEEWLKGENSTAYIYRPILRWKEHECFEMLQKHGIKPNPLYAQGFNRVGCFPCMMCRKAEIKRIADLYPEVIEKLAYWETLVAQSSKLQSASFFTMDETRKNIWDYVEWSKTSRGGKQYQLELTNE